MNLTTALNSVPDLCEIAHSVNLVEAVEQEEQSAGAGLLGELVKQRVVLAVALVLRHLVQLYLAFDWLQDLKGYNRK